ELAGCERVAGALAGRHGLAARVAGQSRLEREPARERRLRGPLSHRTGERIETLVLAELEPRVPEQERGAVGVGPAGRRALEPERREGGDDGGVVAARVLERGARERMPSRINGRARGRELRRRRVR